MNFTPKRFHIALWVMLGVAITLTSLAFNRPVIMAQESADAPVMQTEATPTVIEVSGDSGSTDGIMLLAVVIVLIVVIPILIRRGRWVQGKQELPSK